MYKVLSVISHFNSIHYLVEVSREICLFKYNLLQVDVVDVIIH